MRFTSTVIPRIHGFRAKAESVVMRYLKVTINNRYIDGTLPKELLGNTSDMNEIKAIFLAQT
jgi:hypothetical protein